MKTTIVAIIEGYVPGVYQACHAPETDPVEAIRAAAREYVATPDGQEYLKTDVGNDVFNWGDAVVAIPLATLRQHGIFDLTVGTTYAVPVNHDECITD